MGQQPGRGATEGVQRAAGLIGSFAEPAATRSGRRRWDAVRDLLLQSSGSSASLVRHERPQSRHDPHA